MDYITIALPKGKLFDKSVDLLARVGYSADNVTEDSRKLVITNEESKVRFIITKTVDLPTYVLLVRTFCWKSKRMSTNFWI